LACGAGFRTKRYIRGLSSKPSNSPEVLKEQKGDANKDRCFIKLFGLIYKYKQIYMLGIINLLSSLSLVLREVGSANVMGRLSYKLN